MITVRFTREEIEQAKRVLNEGEMDVLDSNAAEIICPPSLNILVNAETEPILSKLGKMTTNALNVASASGEIELCGHCKRGLVDGVCPVCQFYTNKLNEQIDQCEAQQELIEQAQKYPD